MFRLIVVCRIFRNSNKSNANKSKVYQENKLSLMYFSIFGAMTVYLKAAQLFVPVNRRQSSGAMSAEKLLRE